MSSSSPETIVSWLEEYPLVLDHYAYGTAGFRYQAETLEGLFLRVGLCMALLVKEENMGLMVTASHNDESYNGIKVSQADGSMLNAKDEAVLVEWCNQRDFQQWRQILIIIANNYRQKSPSGVLHIGRDTRSHSERLAKLAIEGAQAMGITVVNHGLMTTPMLHHVVLHSNTNYVPPNLVPAPTRKGYIQQLANAYCALVLALAQHSSSSSCKPLQIDCACGIGYDAVKELNAAVAQKLDTDRFMAHNAPDDGPLNTSCGSEHVQKQLQAPIFYRGQVNDGSYCCSLDGDADRIVFFAHTPSTGLTLLDGDKISVLIAHVLQPLLRKRKAPIQLGVVQTAYANGASTQYLKVPTMNESGCNRRTMLFLFIALLTLFSKSIALL